jgi:hypothetical protein
MTNEQGDADASARARCCSSSADRSATFEMLKVLCRRRRRMPSRDPSTFGAATWIRSTTSTTASTSTTRGGARSRGAGALLTAAPRRYEIDFVASAERGDRLVGRTWPLDDGWAYRLSRRADGTEVFRAKVALNQSGPIAGPAAG